MPDVVSLDEAQAYAIFNAVGVWNQAKVAT